MNKKPKSELIQNCIDIVNAQDVEITGAHNWYNIRRKKGIAAFNIEYSCLLFYTLKVYANPYDGIYKLFLSGGSDGICRSDFRMLYRAVVKKYKELEPIRKQKHKEKIKEKHDVALAWTHSVLNDMQR